MNTKINAKDIKKVLEQREQKNKEYMLNLSDSNALSGFTAKNLSEGQKAQNIELARLKLQAKTQGVTAEHVFRAELKALSKSEIKKIQEV